MATVGPNLLKPPDPKPAGAPRYATVEEVFLALEGPLLGYARRLLGNDGMAEDIVQQAFIRLHQEFASVRQPQPWMYRTVHNLAANHRRHASRMQSIETPPTSVGAPDSAPDAVDPQLLPDEQIARMEGIGQVRLGLELLDERSQELLRLKFEEDLSYRAISERTGLGVGHVGYLLHHAIKKLAAELTKAGALR